MSGDFHKIGNIRGADGKGVPGGGQRGQALVKVGDTDFATGWDHISYSDLTGKVPKEDLPDLGIAPLPVKSEAEMLNLPAVVGNMAIRTDLGKTFVLMEEPASTLENWLELVTTSDVQSVNGKTGNVQLTKADVGLGNVNNTADSDKPEATTSVRGLMPAADKAKLNNATSSATASRLAIRDSAGRIAFKQVTLSDAPTSNSQAATKSYVDTEVGQRVKVLGALGSGVDLNDLVENAVGVQTASVNAKSELNYPEQMAGAIQVIYSGTSMVYQYYTTYHTSGTNIYWRTKYSSTWGAWKRLVDTAMLDTEITAAKKYAQDRFDLVAGGKSVNQLTNWDTTRSTATGIVEGWVKGCPAGGAIDTTHNLSKGFVKDPIWKLEVRAEGLGYVTQRATLLNCVPKYMIGFVWERVYNPAEAKWSAWTCVAGDTGEIRSVDKIIADTTVEEPLVHRNSPNSAILYSTDRPMIVQRQAGFVTISGAMRGYGAELTKTGSSGRSLGWFTTSRTTLGAGDPGCDYTVSHLFPTAYATDGVQQATGDNRWYLERNGNSYYAVRYGPGTPSSNGVWLPFRQTYPAARIGTYTGPGWEGGVVPPQSDTGD